MNLDKMVEHNCSLNHACTHTDMKKKEENSSSIDVIVTIHGAFKHLTIHLLKENKGYNV